MTLRPPRGYESWLEYAVETMDTRTLFLDNIDREYWPSQPSRADMRQAAREELHELLTNKGNSPDPP